MIYLVIIGLFAVGIAYNALKNLREERDILANNIKLARELNRVEIPAPRPPLG